jgi:HEAT repeat protein
MDCDDAPADTAYAASVEQAVHPCGQFFLGFPWQSVYREWNACLSRTEFIPFYQLGTLEPSMRWFGVLGGLTGSILLTFPGMGQTTTTLDEQVLLAAKLPTDDAGILSFLRLRSARTEDKIQLQKLVAQLGSPSFKERDYADKQLVMRGPVALPYLRQVLTSAPLEVVRRAEALIKTIEAMGPEVPVAAVRILAHRQAPGAVEALLGYLSSADDDWIEEEVLASLARLTVWHGKVDPRLLQALDDREPGSRAAAAYVLGRRADASYRPIVRRLLADAEPLVRERAALGLVGKRLPQIVRDMAGPDADLLKRNSLTNEESQLAFLRKRTLSEEDQKRLRRLVDDLGHLKFKLRDEASRLLVKEGPPALAFLKPAEFAADAEVARRARLCIDEIRSGPGPALPIAVAHRLSQPQVKAQSPAMALAVLLAYAPFADDDTVEEEVINALTMLSARETALDPLLPAALTDPLPARRGAAALVLGRVGGKEHLPALSKLLNDPAPTVRFRAAQGLIAAKEKSAVPRLIALLNDMPSQHLAAVEDQLQRLAGDQVPNVAVGEGFPAVRAKAVKAWDQWWQSQASSFDLTRLGDPDTFLGLTTIVEYDSAAGMPGGQVWETARHGPPRWKVAGFLGAMDGQVLPNGNVLVAENSANRVSERAKDGSIKWEHRINGNPIACQRLPNGNTFIAAYNQLMEIDPQGKLIYNHNRGPAFYLFSAHKSKAGKIVCMTAQGAILEIDAQSGKELRTINLGPNGGWCGVEALSSGRYLVATMNNSLVREIDADGKTHWQASFPGVFRASRMPNGHTLVASMTTKKVAELDRNGQVRWEKTCEGRPWAVHWR